MAATPTAQVQTGSLQTGAIKQAAASQLLEEQEEESGVMPFAIVCLVLAIAVLCIELFSSQKFFPSALPEETNPYEKQRSSTGEWMSNFALPELPEAPAE